MLCFTGHLYEKATFLLSNLVVVNFLWGQTPEVLVEAVNCFLETNFLVAGVCLVPILWLPKGD